jgi:hypothetical protein
MHSCKDKEKQTIAMVLHVKMPQESQVLPQTFTSLVSVTNPGSPWRLTWQFKSKECVPYLVEWGTLWGSLLSRHIARLYFPAFLKLGMARWFFPVNFQHKWCVSLPERDLKNHFGIATSVSNFREAVEICGDGILEPLGVWLRWAELPYKSRL